MKQSTLPSARSYLLLLFLLLAGCDDPQPLPTDSAGPMLTGPQEAVTALPGAGPLLILHECRLMDDGTFWIIDPVTNELYSWQPPNLTESSTGPSGANPAMLAFEPERECLTIDPQYDVLVVVADGRAGIVSDVGRAITSTDPRRMAPVLSPDRRWLFMGRAYAPGFYERRGGREVAVDHSGWPLDWTADGRRVLASGEDGTFIAEMAGGSKMLPGPAGADSFQVGQWLSDTAVALLREGQLYHVNLDSGEMTAVAGMGHVLYFRYSPERRYLATVEAVECERRPDNDSWIIGSLRCVDEIFLYDGDAQNRRRMTDVDFIVRNSVSFRPVWLNR